MTLRNQLASLVNAMGYQFIGCELLRQGRKALLRIYIDSEQGIKITDCSKVSHQISAMLDVEDPIPGQYSLEISSPGLDRPLFELTHYQKQIGKRITVRTRVPLQERCRFTGVLLQVTDTEIHLLVDTKEMVLVFANIEKANVIADI